MVRLVLNGSPRLVADDGTVRLLAPRDAALLAWLAIEGPTARERIVELLWPGADRARAQTHLRQRVFRLNDKPMGDIVDGDPLLKLASAVEVDRSPETSDDEPPKPWLDGIDTSGWPTFDSWLQLRRRQDQTRRRTRHEQRIDQLESTAELDAALTQARRWADEFEDDESAHRRIMWLCYRLGDRTAARAAFETCRQALARTCDAQPDAQTLQLLATIERGAELPPRAVSISHAVRRPPKLVARDTACAAIDAAWAGRRPVLVIGPPGVGKSRLLTDVAASRGVGMAPVCALQGDAGIAYSLIARLLTSLAARHGQPPDWPRDELARLVHGWGSSPTTLLQPLRLRQAIDAAIDAWQVRGLGGIVVDDLQYADETSLEWLIHFAGRTETSGLPLLLSVRAAEVPAPLSRWQSAAGEAHLCVVPLEPLDLDETTELLESLALPGLRGVAWARGLRATASGLPFDLLERVMSLQARGVGDFSTGPALLALDIDGIPATLERIERLSTDAGRLARIAAVAGQDFSVELAARLLECSIVAVDGPWRALERAGVFDDGGRYAHDLTRDAVLRSLPRPVARALHAQVAGWLDRPEAASGGAESRSSRIAEHREAAEAWQPAAAAYEHAAADARGRSAHREQATALAGAVRCSRRAGAADAARAFECEWRRLRLVPGEVSLDAVLEGADALLATARSPLERAAALEARALIHGHRYESEAALADAQEAIGLASVPGGERLRVLAALQAAMAWMRLSRHDESLRVLAATDLPLDRLEPAERLVWRSETATALDYADRRDEALIAFDGAIEHAEREGLWEGANEAWCNKSIALVFANRLDDSTAAIERGIDCGRRAGFGPRELLLDTMMLATNLRDLGRYAESLALAESLPQQLRDAGYTAWAHNAESDLAGTFLWLGRHDLAYRAMTPPADDVPAAIRAARLFTRAHLLRQVESIGVGEPSPGDLVRAAAGLLDEAGGSGRSYVRLKVALEMARDQPHDEAIETAVAIEAEARQRQQFMLAVHARVLRVKLMLSAGRSSDAAEAARVLVDSTVTAAAYPPDIWWTARRALEPHDPALARRALQRASDWIDEVAARHVPSLFRRSFLERNPVNRAVRLAMRAEVGRPA